MHVGAHWVGDRDGVWEGVTLVLAREEDAEGATETVLVLVALTDTMGVTDTVAPTLTLAVGVTEAVMDPAAETLTVGVKEDDWEAVVDVKPEALFDVEGVGVGLQPATVGSVRARDRCCVPTESRYLALAPVPFTRLQLAQGV
jgi:hypothetical protein